MATPSGVADYWIGVFCVDNYGVPIRASRAPQKKTQTLVYSTVKPFDCINQKQDFTVGERMPLVKYNVHWL